MLSKISSAVLDGIKAAIVQVEVNIGNGLPEFHVVGLADRAVKEASERVRPALENSGFTFPFGRIVVNIAPASLKKRGSLLDLPMAIGIMSASKIISPININCCGVIGELSLDGALHHADGVLPMVMAMKESGFKSVILPSSNAREAGLVGGIDIFPAENLRQVSDHISGAKEICHWSGTFQKNVGCCTENSGDYADVKGQEMSKRAITIAAAGGHGLLMTGSPSTGKTMLASRLTSILPPMTKEEITQVTSIYSVSGKLSPYIPFVTQRPFRHPHHRITQPALIGGGLTPKPGEVTLASGGVLFLDELCEFESGLIECLRQPLEERKVTVARNGGVYEFPANFIFIAATNPCPCGFYGDKEHECKCSEYQIRRYRSKISGPIMDRIDMHLDLKAIKYDELKTRHCTSSSEMMKCVTRARQRQTERFGHGSTELNGRIKDSDMDNYISISNECDQLLKNFYEKMKLSPRSLSKVKKVARTIADIDDSIEIETQHIAEAIQYRKKF